MNGNTFKKAFIVCLAMAFLTLSFFGCDNKNNSNVTIATPDKIIIYYNNQSKEIDNTNDEFKYIVKLTNERFSKEKLVMVQDIVTNEFVDNLKKEQLSIEFVYNDEQKMDTRINELSEIKYNRLFFNLVNKSPEYKSSHAATFQYGDKDNYMKSSFGTLEQSKKLKHLSSNVF